MQYQLRPPEMLDMDAAKFFIFTVPVGSKNMNTRTTDHRDWKSCGLFDLQNRSIQLQPNLFDKENAAVVFSIFSRLGDLAALEDVYAYLEGSGPCRSWFANVISWSTQTQIMVCPRYAPTNRYKWLCQELLLSRPFDDEDAMLTADSVASLHVPHILNPINPLSSLCEFIIHKLAYWPVGYRYLWNTVANSWHALQNLCNPDNPEFYDISYPVTDEAVGDKAMRDYDSYTDIVFTAHSRLLSDLPEWQQDIHQSTESWLEQQECRTLLLHKLQIVASMTTSREHLPLPRPVYISGPPGCGKTFLALQALKSYNAITSRERRYDPRHAHTYINSLAYINTVPVLIK